MTKIASVLFGNADSDLAREYFCTFESDSPLGTESRKRKEKKRKERRIHHREHRGLRGKQEKPFKEK
jgi:hypothetical protein